MDIQKTSWGTIYNYKYNGYKFSIYTYTDDPKVVYLSNVFVEESRRGCGLGNTLLRESKSAATELGAVSILLKVIENSWLYNWYKSFGYRDLCYDGDTLYIWMKYELKTNI